MRRWLKITLKVTAVFVTLLFLTWGATAIYVQSHKQQLLESITRQLNERINGQLTIKSMEPALIRGFPGISVSLTNVLLRDSLWSRHKHTLLDAKNVYIAINIFSLISGNPTIKNIEINNGQIYMYTDTSGVSNTDLFRKGKVTGKEEGGGGSNKINSLKLDNVRFTYENKLKKKLIRLDIDRMLGDIRYKGTGWKGAVSLKAQVKDLIFNTLRGSFVKNKSLDAALDMNYDRESKQFSIVSKNFRINKNKMSVSGKLMYGTGEPTYSLDIKVPRILLKDAAALLTSNIASRLNGYDLKKPIDVSATIAGKLKQPGNPLIKAAWTVTNNAFSLFGETVTNCSFTGVFTNEVKPAAGYTDSNSSISFYNMTGQWLNIPFNAPFIKLNDLKNTVFSGRFKANFPLIELNPVFGEQTFVFTAGTASLDILYTAPYNKNTNRQRYINGTIHVKNAAASYKPRGINFKEVVATLNFTGQDLLLQNVKVKSGTTSLDMHGTLRNFVNLYYTDPKKILLDWQIKSPQINLNEFLVFLSKRKSNVIQTNSTSMRDIARRLDLMLEQASARMRLDVASLLYKKFEGTNVKADVTLKEAGITINNVSLSHGGGSLQVSGKIDQSLSVNRFALTSRMSNINVQKLFYAFNNFGQDAITDKNLRGTFFGNTAVTGSITEDGKVVPGSFNGLVQFDIRNGALLDFEPLQKAGAFAFPNRDFKNIIFTSLKNTIDLHGDMVTIRPMRIETSVLNVFLEGVYGFSSGTNIGLQIPLRDPKKDELLPDDGETGRFTKGLLINIRAVDVDGKVKFKLGRKDL